MKYSLFKKMTKQTPKRVGKSLYNKVGALCFKIKLNVFELLSKLHLVVKHVNNSVIPWGDNDPNILPDLKSDRFVFSVSYLIRQFDFINEYWFENKKGTKLFVVDSSHRSESRISYRAELKSFLVHLTHKDKRWVSIKAPRVVLQSDNIEVANNVENKEVRTITCDFSKCRFAFDFSFNLEHTDTTSEEVISESYRVLKDRLTSKVAEINEMLVGVKNDGAMTSPKNQPLADNLICSECGYPLFMSSIKKYGFECINHGEIEKSSIKRVDPLKYEGILKYCEFELERFCECPQDSTFR